MPSRNLAADIQSCKQINKQRIPLKSHYCARHEGLQASGDKGTLILNLGNTQWSAALLPSKQNSVTTVVPTA